MVDNSLDEILQGRSLRRTAKKMLKEEYRKIEEYLEGIDEREKIDKVEVKKELVFREVLRYFSLIYLVGVGIGFAVVKDYINLNLNYILSTSAALAAVYGATAGYIRWLAGEYNPSVIKSTTESIYFHKLEDKIKELREEFNSNNREIKNGDIVPLSLTQSITGGIVDYPIYIDKKENIEKNILRSYIDVALIHEVTDIILGENNTKAYVPHYALQFLMYLDMNGFLDVNDPYKHEKVEEIIEKNVKRCIEYVRNSKEINLHAMGECYMCIKLRENDFSIDTKHEIKELKYMDDEDIIKEVKKYAGVPYRKFFGYYFEARI